jgi:hypothetical protein
MPPRGKPINPLRAAALANNERFYADDHDCFCGTNKRYTKNGSCVACSIARGKAKYAALTDDQKAEHARRDHERYQKRLAEGKV